MSVLTGSVSVDTTHHAWDGMMANDDHAAAVTRSRAEWARLRRRLETVTPGALARVGLTLAAAGVIGGVVLGTWPATLPFLVGSLIAYAVLPLVNRLDGAMPRPLAAAVSVLSVVALLIGIIAVVLPPLVAGFVQFAATLPGERDVDAALADAEAWLGGQPLGSDVLAPALSSIVLAIRENMESASGGLGDLAVGVARGLAGALGAAIGLIILPTWMLTLLSDQRRGRAAIDRRVAPWLRGDFWAIVRIVDRIASTYIRGFIVVGLVVGVLTYLGIRLVEAAGGPDFAQPFPLAVLAGATQLVPEIGPFLGILPALLILPIAPDRAAAYVGVYLAARWLGSGMVGGRLLERRLGVHPALLIPSIVILTQFGWIWLFIAAPIVSIAVTTVRYIHGRLSDPPRPAGVLPWDPVPRATRAAAAGARGATAHVPVVYRSMTSAR
jgi:predicted PurR-regulated permease PerM